MKDYFFGVFLVCIASGIVCTVAPLGSVKKYIEFICAACVLCCIVAPIIQGIAGGDYLEYIFDGADTQEGNYDEIYNSYLESADEYQARELLSRGMSEELGLARESFCIELVVAKTEVSRAVERVRVYIIGLDAFTQDPADIRAYVKRTVGCECDIIYGTNDEKL